MLHRLALLPMPLTDCALSRREKPMLGYVQLFSRSHEQLLLRLRTVVPYPAPAELLQEEPTAVRLFSGNFVPPERNRFASFKASPQDRPPYRVIGWVNTGQGDGAILPVSTELYHQQFIQEDRAVWLLEQLTQHHAEPRTQQTAPSTQLIDEAPSLGKALRIAFNT